MMQIKQQGVNSNNMKLTQKFCKQAILTCQESDIFNCIQALTNCQELTKYNHQTLETLNSEITKILTSADQNCVKQGNHPWSPQLHTAYLIHHYWLWKLSQKHMGCNYPQAVTKIESQIPQINLYPAHPTSITINLQAAQKNLKQIHQEAKAKCQATLMN